MTLQQLGIPSNSALASALRAIGWSLPVPDENVPIVPGVIPVVVLGGNPLAGTVGAYKSLTCTVAGTGLRTWVAAKDQNSNTVVCPTGKQWRIWKYAGSESAKANGGSQLAVLPNGATVPTDNMALAADAQSLDLPGTGNSFPRWLSGASSAPPSYPVATLGPGDTLGAVNTDNAVTLYLTIFYDEMPVPT